MVRSYFRHGPTEVFGLVCSASSNSIFDGKLAYVPALEDVLVWDVKRGTMAAMWHESGHRAEVTYILRSPKPDVFAVGYSDGSIRLWSASSGSVITAFNGHKKAVTALAFDQDGSRLASGSQDTDLIIWDVVAEAGLYRLRGHRDQITAIKFLDISANVPSTSSTSGSTFVVTTSKDSFLKVWDLSTQHCVQTTIAHRSEVWSLDVNPEKTLIFTGSSEGEMKVWRIDSEALSEGLKESESGEITKMIRPVTTIPLSSKHRVSQLSFHPRLQYLAVQSHDRSVEIFRVRTEEEIRKKQARREKRVREKKKEKGQKEPDMGDEGNEEEQEVDLVELFTPYLIVRSSGKIRSFDFGGEAAADAKGSTHIFLALGSNALEVQNIPPPPRSRGNPPEATRLYTLGLPGHRTDIRTLSLSSDDMLLASASNGSLKIWNIKTTACIRTLDCGHAICSTFLPNDRQIVVGTKNGEILIYDLASASLVDTVKAHTGTLWSMHIRPDGCGLITGGADKDVKFWDIEEKQFNEDDPRSTTISSLVHARTLKMTDDVLSVRYSPNGKLLAVSLLDSTVKVFYQDSLKFFLSLYGHKLPVLSMDISHDSKLIVTCSADKNVKIWGLDFGDCHRSIFAHDEPIMQVAFEKESHYFWTVSKDKMVKYWDGDKVGVVLICSSPISVTSLVNLMSISVLFQFEKIQTLEGHHGEVWALAVSNRGDFVVTGSHDKSIRIWEKLDDPLFLEEERERDLEKLYDGNLAETMNRNDDHVGIDWGANGGDSSGTQEQAEVAQVTKQTTETLMAGEKIMEALDVADADLALLAEFEAAKSGLNEAQISVLPAPARNPLLAMQGLEAEEYVLQVIEKVPPTALQDALLVLPFNNVLSLMRYLDEWARRGWNIVLVSRILFFTLRTHHHQIVTNRVMRTTLIPLRKHLRDALRKQKETMGYNLAALQYIQRQNEAQRTAKFYEEESFDEERVKARIAEGKKRKRVVV
ncbi:WD-repeat-containing protein [Thelephora ganbajun]|uniref:WD-repeat-containing protein n=1 Tax=Thelephora ganbajun TaxID=370292 RepID=A0ACB6ZWG7_THEGA|nr:WD-repeat-containing protein [Thelephora ganbajun]